MDKNWNIKFENLDLLIFDLDGTLIDSNGVNNQLDVELARSLGENKRKVGIIMNFIKFDKTNNKSIAYDNDIKIGECEFVESGETWNIIHTEVSQSYQGQGIAKRLVEDIIKNAKINNKKLIADCSYAEKVLEKLNNKK